MYSIQKIIETSYNIYSNKLESCLSIPTSEIRILLQHTLNKSLAQLITDDNYVLSDIEYHQFNNMVLQRHNNIPIAYIVGYKEFYSREFIVNEHTLIPRSETELLIDTTLKLASLGNNVLDMGTGSGCIAITLKLESPDLCVDALDNYPETLQIAMQNADKLDAKIKFIQSNWFSNITKKYNIIVSNPPYIANNDIHLAKLSAEPLHALSDLNDGLDHIRHIINIGRKYLISGGYMIIEHGYDQGKSLRELFNDYNFTAIKTIQDFANLDRITFAQFL